MTTILLFALLVVLVLRPLLKWLTRPETGMIAGGGSAGKLASGAPRLLKESATGREQIVQLARADTEHFAKVLKNWIS